MPAEKAGYIASISVARVRRRSIAELLSNVDRDLGRGSFLGHLVQLGDLLSQSPRLAVPAAGDEVPVTPLDQAGVHRSLGRACVESAVVLRLFL